VRFALGADPHYSGLNILPSKFPKKIFASSRPLFSIYVSNARDRELAPLSFSTPPHFFA
jgi:hypothetical protein